MNHTKSMILEACVGNLEEAQRAELLGAHQIELCDRLDLDGISPSIDMVSEVSSILKIPVKVIVNPKPYNYLYSNKDIDNILEYVEKLNNLPIHGLVFGPITKEGIPDVSLIETLSRHTELPITYHKAIDICSDIFESTQILVDQNIVKFILSSGGTLTAQDGSTILLEMQKIVEPSEIQLIAAGNITSKNLARLHREVKLSYYHGKKIVGDLTS